MEKIRKAPLNANRILVEELKKLSNFNNGNLNKNIETLKRVITNNLLVGNQILI